MGGQRGKVSRAGKRPRVPRRGRRGAAAPHGGREERRRKGRCRRSAGKLGRPLREASSVAVQCMVPGFDAAFVPVLAVCRGARSLGVGCGKFGDVREW